MNLDTVLLHHSCTYKTSRERTVPYRALSCPALPYPALPHSARPLILIHSPDPLITTTPHSPVHLCFRSVNHSSIHPSVQNVVINLFIFLSLFIFFFLFLFIFPPPSQTLLLFRRFSQARPRHPVGQSLILCVGILVSYIFVKNVTSRLHNLRPQGVNEKGE